MGKEGQIQLDHFKVDIDRNESGLVLSTVVFADGYVPPSVRAFVAEESKPIHSSLFASKLKIDEEARSVILTGTLVETGVSREEIMAEFLEIASEWQARLHEGGQRDLIYVKKV
jgi:hypothetical protein